MSMKPMLAMVEYASMRLTLDWEIAITLPTIIDSSERTINIPCQSKASAASEPTRIRVMNANAANSGALPMKMVIAVGAPWYTSGTHMWYGTAPSLNAIAETTNTNPKIRMILFACPLKMMVVTRLISSVPVAL